MFYFQEIENQEKLLDSIKSWLGVPHEHMGETKSGVDCTKLIVEILIELGVLKGRIEKLWFPPDWVIHGQEEKLLNSLNRTFAQFLNRDFIFDKIKVFQPQDLIFGDLLFFSLLKNGLTGHSAIYLEDGEIFHCMTKKACGYWILTESWKNRLTYIYRLKRL